MATAAYSQGPRVISIPTKDLVYDPVTRRIYASVPGSAGPTRANTVTVIDPETGQVEASVFIGSEPGKLALSDNGQLLYVSLDGAAAVRQFDVAARTAGLQFSLGSDPFFGPYFVEDMEVQPGNHSVVAISLKNLGFSPRHAGVALYVNGVAAPALTPRHTGSNVIEFGNTPGRLYGYNNETTEYGFRRMDVTSGGVTILESTPSLITGFSEDIEYEAGQLYSSTGRVIDPEARSLLGTFPGLGFSALVRPAGDLGRVFFLTDNMTITKDRMRSYDRATFAFIGEWAIPGIAGNAGSLIRWGETGLAFRTDGQVFLLSAPVSAADSYTTTLNTTLTVNAPGVLGNDLDKGGGPLVAEIVTSTVHGSITLQTDGSFIYSPQAGFIGTDSFTYRAKNMLGTSEVVTATISVTTVLMPPTDLYALSIQGNHVTLRWTPPDLGLTPTGYVIEGGVTPSQVLAHIDAGVTPTISFTAPSGVFFVRVYSVRDSSRSADGSNQLRIVVNDAEPPTPPTGLLGLVNGSMIALSWRNTFAGGAPTEVIVDVEGGAQAAIPLPLTENFTFPAVPSGTYTFRVRSVNGAGTSTPSNAVTINFPGPCSGPPMTPTSFLAFAIGRTVYAMWDPPPTGHAPTAYVLDVTGAFVGSISTSQRLLTGTAGPGSYGLSVSASNPCGSSAPTAVQTVSVP